MSSQGTLTPFGFHELPVADAQRRLDDFFVLDVRELDELSSELSHIPKIHHVPLVEVPKRLEELPSDRPILIVCRSGARSASACAWLRQRGFRDLYNLSGGMIAWNEAGYDTAATK